MFGFFSVFLITLGLGQLMVTIWRLWGASLVGSSRWAGAGLGMLLLGAGAWLLPNSWGVLGWTLLAGPLAGLVLLWGGSYLRPPPGPHTVFEPDHPAHGSCLRIDIPNGDRKIPAILLKPSTGHESQAAVCLVHGAGDHKTFFKSQLIVALLNEGLTVLTIDLPGHGDDRTHPLSYPAVLSVVPAALRYLRKQPGLRRIGVLGISLGGAITTQSLAKAADTGLVEAVVIVATPLRLWLTRSAFFREMWQTLFQSPARPLVGEMSAKQGWETWRSGGYQSRMTTDDLFSLLKPEIYIGQLSMPLLLIYSKRDTVATLSQAQTLKQAAPHAELIIVDKASHVALTLMPRVNQQIAAWLRKHLGYDR